MKKRFMLFVLAFPLFAFAFPSGASEYGDILPSWFIPLRDAVYEQKLGADEVYPIYLQTRKKCESELSGDALGTALSRCDYFMGRVYQFYKLDDKALALYESGYDAAKKALSVKESAAAWELSASHLSQLCMLKSYAFVMKNGLDVEKFCKNALKLDKKNAPAYYMIASRWVYAPWPLNDTPKGITMMKEMLDGRAALQKDDLFNVYSAIAYAYIRDKNKTEAKIWLDKSLEIYPTNKYVGVELKAKLD